MLCYGFQGNHFFKDYPYKVNATPSAIAAHLAFKHVTHAGEHNMSLFRKFLNQGTVSGRTDHGPDAKRFKLFRFLGGAHDSMDGNRIRAGMVEQFCEDGASNIACIVFSKQSTRYRASIRAGRADVEESLENLVIVSLLLGSANLK